MSSLLAFAEHHPVWTLVYLVVIAAGASGLFRITITFKEPKE